MCDVDITDAALAAAVVEATGGNIESSALTSAGLAPIRALTKQGVDMERDIAPVLWCVRDLRRPLRTFAAPWIADRLNALKSNRPQTTAPTPPPSATAQGRPRDPAGPLSDTNSRFR